VGGEMVETQFAIRKISFWGGECFSTPALRRIMTERHCSPIVAS